MESVAVFFGGQSTEHDVSIVTALVAIIPPLKASHQYNVIPIYISKDGSWYSDDSLADIKLYSSGKIEDSLRKLKPILISFSNGLQIQKSKNNLLRNETINIDVAYTALHGTTGEDGSLMGLLNMANVPYVGCGLESSVLAMNKVITKQIAEIHNIPTPGFISFSSADFATDRSKIINSIKGLDYPLFVKPVHLGSSIGITRVAKPSELESAIEVAAHLDDIILVEEGVQNLIEVTLPIIGSTDSPILASVEQSTLNAEGVFDFDAKYIGQGGKNGKGGKISDGTFSAEGYSKIPAEISPRLMQDCKDIATKAWKSLGLHGIARVDMLIDSKAKKVYFNEVNPLPGSLYMHNWVASGFSPVEVNTKLIELAKERFQQQKKITRSYSTNFLKQF